MNWRELTQKVSRDPAGTRVLILSKHANEELVTQAIHAGVAGYLLKDSSAQELEDAPAEGRGVRPTSAPPFPRTW